MTYKVSDLAKEEISYKGKEFKTPLTQEELALRQHMMDAVNISSDVNFDRTTFQIKDKIGITLDLDIHTATNKVMKMLKEQNFNLATLDLNKILSRGDK